MAGLNPLISLLLFLFLQLPSFCHSQPTYSGTIANIKDLANQQVLSLSEKQAIIDSALLIFTKVNPNNDVQKNFLNVDVVEKLDKIRANLGNFQSSYAFHLQLYTVFNSLNDGHTTYTPPHPMKSATGSLGFFVHRYYDSAMNSRYVMTSKWSVLPFEHPTFVPGVEIKAVDGRPVHQVVVELGKQGFARKEDDYVRFGQFYLTFRDLRHVGEQMKTSVLFEYKALDKSIQTVSVPIIYLFSLPDGVFSLPDGVFSILDPSLRNLHFTSNRSRSALQIPRAVKGDSVGTSSSSRMMMLKQCFIPNHDVMNAILASEDKTHHAKTSTQTAAALSESAELQRGTIVVNKKFGVDLMAEVITTSSGVTFGRLVVNSFFVGDLKKWGKEIQRLLGVLPKDNLVIDIRNNLGGSALASLLLWEYVTDKKISAPPYKLQGRATPIMMNLLKDQALSNLLPNFRTHIAMGSTLSGPVEDVLADGIRNPKERAPQVFFGKVITLVSSFTASSGDIYASLVRDVGRTELLGVDESTNGAGASTVSFNYLAELSPKVLKELPKGVDFNTAFFRFYRANDFDGALVEHFGVPVTTKYYERKKDLLNDGVGMFKFIGAMFDANKNTNK